MGVFKIDVDQLEWLGGVKDDPQDLCLHGHVTVQIGENLLVRKKPFHLLTISRRCSVSRIKWKTTINPVCPRFCRSMK